MQILTIDVGTGTQDILLYDSERELENCPAMIMPSPTALVADQIRAATARREDLVLTGVTMGGGPSSWAARDHIKARLLVYATPSAARTFDDDLDAVRKMGVVIVSDDEVPALRNTTQVQLRDLDFESIEIALKQFGVRLQPDALAVAVFDHGAAPPDVSDRLFRFQYIERVVRQRNNLTSFAYRAEDIPKEMTRFAAVEETVRACCPGVPLAVMDTGPAAVLGALEDPKVSENRSCMVANVGNFHTLAFHLRDRRIVALFEHHTGMLTREKLDDYLTMLANGTLDNQKVFEDSGHGALVLEKPHDSPTFLGVTGPRQALARGSVFNPHCAVPHGSMMLAGCFGLLRATAALLPDWAAKIEQSLA